MEKYKRELARLRDYCEQTRFTRSRASRGNCSPAFVPRGRSVSSTYTRAKVRERVRSFLRYCYEAQWIPRIPAMSKIKVEEPPTMPLTAAEYKRLLDAVYGRLRTRNRQAQVHALIQLMMERASHPGCPHTQAR